MAATPDPLAALVVGLLLLAAVAIVVWPRFGLLSRLGRMHRSSRRVQIEDTLKYLYEAEIEDRPVSLEGLAGMLAISMDRAARLLETAEQRGLIRWDGPALRLTDDGRDYALHVLRAHRLWERHLADRTGYAAADWHGLAERYEHTLSPQDVRALSADLGHPTYDPHGDPIPTAEGYLRAHNGFALSAAPVGDPLRIAHLEDEPEAVFAQLVAEGLRPGMHVHVIEQRPERVRFRTEAGEHVLAPMLAANITVVPAPEAPDVEADPAFRLADLALGEHARIVRLSGACRGAERRRLLDLGLTPGTVVEVALQRSGRETTAYRIRGALIALRREQAARILIERVNHHDHESSPADTLV